MKITKTLTLLLALGLATTASASSLEKMGAKQGRSFHQMNYDQGCKSCHDQGMRQPPSDGQCLMCHDKTDLIEATSEQKKKWMNPHNNMHYGDKVPCIECHGEHKAKAPLCADCHNFDFDGFQQD